jgi:hypothetical protein
VKRERLAGRGSGAHEQTHRDTGDGGVHATACISVQITTGPATASPSAARSRLGVYTVAMTTTVLPVDIIGMTRAEEYHYQFITFADARLLHPPSWAGLCRTAGARQTAGYASTSSPTSSVTESCYHQVLGNSIV